LICILESFELFKSFFELCFFYFFFVFVPFQGFFLGVPDRVSVPPSMNAPGALSGAMLTDAARKAAPASLVRELSRYAKARTSTSAVAAACCSGGVIKPRLDSKLWTFSQHPSWLNHDHPDQANCQLCVPTAMINHPT